MQTRIRWLITDSGICVDPSNFVTTKRFQDQNRKWNIQIGNRYGGCGLIHRIRGNVFNFKSDLRSIDDSFKCSFRATWIPLNSIDLRVNTLIDETGDDSGYTWRGQGQEAGPSTADGVQRDQRHQIGGQFQGAGDAVGHERAVRQNEQSAPVAVVHQRDHHPVQSISFNQFYF